MHRIQPSFNTVATELGMSSAEIDQLNFMIASSKEAWMKQLNQTDQSFLYLKRKEISSPHTIQVFRDGRIWVHTNYAMCGTAKKLKVILDWKTGKQLMKGSRLPHLRKVGPRAGKDPIPYECKIYEKLKGKRGIVPLVDAFSYASKSSPNNIKHVLVQERWICDLNRKRKWSKEDVLVIAIDLLYAVKAFKEAELAEGDFHRGNVLVLCDQDGKALKAGLIDFEQTETLSEAKEKYRFPNYIDFELQNDMLLLIRDLYRENNLDEAEIEEILSEGYYQRGGDFLIGGKIEEHIPTLTIDQIIKKFENMLRC